jgi:hypothetical protein
MDEGGSFFGVIKVQQGAEPNPCLPEGGARALIEASDATIHSKLPAAPQSSWILSIGPSLPSGQLLQLQACALPYHHKLYQNMSFFEFSASDLESLAKLLTPPAEAAEVLLLCICCCCCC